MKKYRLKVDSPWGKKGSVVNSDDSGAVFCPISFVDGNNYPFFINPSRYQDIFEEVIEPTDEEIIEKWFIRNFHDISVNSKQWNKVAKALIQHGFNAKKLRGGV